MLQYFLEREGIELYSSLESDCNLYFPTVKGVDRWWNWVFVGPWEIWPQGGGLGVAGSKLGGAD